MTTTPKIILRLMLAISLFCFASALAGMLIAFKGQSWYMLAFEVVVLISAVPGVMIGAGRVRSGHAMGMLCLGGVIGITAVLIDPELMKALIQRQTPKVDPVWGVNILPWILARLAAGVLLVGMSALTALLRKPGRSFPLLAKGMAFALPLLVCGGLVLVPSMRGKLAALSPVSLIVIAIAGTAILSVLIAASGHLIIRAFQVGITDDGEAARR